MNKRTFDKAFNSMLIGNEAKEVSTSDKTAATIESLLELYTHLFYLRLKTQLIIFQANQLRSHL